MRTIYRILFLTPVVVLLAIGAVNAQGGQQLNDPGKLGQYAVGHTSYLMFNPKAPGPPKTNGRPVFISVFYPVDAGAITSSTPPAQYLTDPYAVLTYTGTGTNLDTGGFPPGTSTSSADWEKLGYDRAYEGPTPSHDGPFPLLMVSPENPFYAESSIDDEYFNYNAGSWDHIFIGTRLASHGYVVALLDHWADGQWPWSPSDVFPTVMFNRPRDVSFAITKLLAKSSTRGELLSGAIDPERIAASGRALGGYAAYTLAGGDDLVCDALWPAITGNAALPYPESTCVPTPPDPRIKAIIPIDAYSQLLQYSELARISVPSLILGDNPDQEEDFLQSQPVRALSARPHAAINRYDSYRVDVNGAGFESFTDWCDAWQIFYNLGQISDADLAPWENSWPCVGAATMSRADAREVITKYMIAFLDIYLGGPNINKTLDWQILTPEYGLSHTPSVQLFNSQSCQAALPDNSYFSYRPYQLYIECDVAQKDPTGWFALSSASGNPAPMLRTPAQAGPFRPLKKSF